jgi:hypothetical protein
MRSHPRGETSAGAIQMPLGPSRCSSDGLAQPAARLAGIHLPSNQLAAAGVVAAAFALLPDIDEPGSTVSRKLGTMSLPSPRSRTDWPAGIIKRPTASCSPPLSQEPCSVGPVPALTCMLSSREGSPGLDDGCRCLSRSQPDRRYGEPRLARG